MQTQDPLNQRDDSENETVLFKSQVKSARIKSAVVAGISSSIVFIAFMLFTSFGKTIFPKLFMSSCFTMGSFILTYQFTFCFGFGKKIIPKLYGKCTPWEPVFYTDSTDRVIDTLNSARGYGPGRGCLGSPSLTPIDDSHHHRY
jgi:hypothetical protein